LTDAARQAVVEQQVVLAAGDRGGDGLGGVESGGDVGDLLAQRPEAVEHCRLADEVSGEQRAIASCWMRGKRAGSCIQSASASRPLSVSV
jgi:hypothetical protein